MAAQPILHSVVPTLEGAVSLECPPELIRGQEDRFFTFLLPIIERTDVVLDMAQVSAMDAAGIGMLVYLRRCADRAGNSLVLINPSQRVVEMLSLVHLDDILLSN